MLLYGKPIADSVKTKLKSQVLDFFGERKSYVAILFFGDNSSSATYVKHKVKYWKEIWITTLVFGQQQSISNPDFIQLNQRAEKNYESVEEIFELISLLNNDPDCVGIMIQLPLQNQFAEHKLKLLQAIAENKDIDGLGGSLVGKSFFEMLEFTPATPRAVLSLLDYYQLGDLRGKSVAIIWQSTIVGKPLALACLQRGARVQCFDIRNTPAELQKWCQEAEYLFCGTGSIHLINANHINEKGNQILIDIWYGHKDGKPVGDIDFDAVVDKVAHITPVPGGVGPLTIASLFENVLSLTRQFWSQ